MIKLRRKLREKKNVTKYNRFLNLLIICHLSIYHIFKIESIFVTVISYIFLVSASIALVDTHSIQEY